MSQEKVKSIDHLLGICKEKMMDRLDAESREILPKQDI
jgi:hypothetical protein